MVCVYVYEIRVISSAQNSYLCARQQNFPTLVIKVIIIILDYTSWPAAHGHSRLSDISLPVLQY